LSRNEESTSYDGASQTHSRELVVGYGLAR
jgi:hypothetical protein